MKESLDNDNLERGTNRFLPLYASFIYCMMINRISRGYSAEELSFLLGKDDDFVANLELLKRIDFSVDLYGHLYKVFGHADFIHHQHETDQEVQYEMTTWLTDNTIYYRMESFVNAHESVLFFQLTEEHPNCRKRYINSVNTEVGGCQKVLYMMIEQGLFNKPLTALDIYRQVEDILETKVDPINLKTELDKLWGRKGKTPLKRTQRRSYGYRYVLHQDIHLDNALDFVNQKFDKV